MSDKQERWFVVSEGELLAIREGHNDVWQAEQDSDYDALDLANDETDKAYAACRARPLEGVPDDLRKALIGVKGYSLKGWVRAPEWATHFCKLSTDLLTMDVLKAEKVKK